MKDKRKRKVSILLVIGNTLLAVFLYVSDSFIRLEHIAFDATARQLRGNLETTQDVVVILIDEASLQALNSIVGRWPWPRAVYSDLLEFLAMGEPRAVFFDIMFAENQETLDDGEIGPNDRALVLATYDSGNVFHAMQLLVDKEDEKNKTLLNRPLPKEFADNFSLPEVSINFEHHGEANNYYTPIYELAMASKGIGVVEFTSDEDGIYRQTRPFREYHGKYFPVAGIAPLLSGEKIEIEKKRIRIGDKNIPTNREGKIIINPYGKINPFSISGLFSSLQMIKSGDIESLLVHPDEFRDKIVYIGASAVGVEDLKPTAISPLTPGVYLHASLASNYIDNDFFSYVDRKTTFVFIIIFSIICTLAVLYLGKFRDKLALPLACLGGWVGAYIYAFNGNFLMELMPPAGSIVFSGATAFAFLAATEGREKLRVKKMFSQYVSPEVLNQMAENIEDFAALGKGEEVNLTIMFTDIRGFTAFSDKTSPEMVIKMLNSYLSRMCDVILKNQGTVDKFIGDAIMAFWGAPLKIKNHAEMAVRSAIEMAARMDAVNAEIKEMGVDFTVMQGIGINTGPAILGNIGSEKKLSYTVIGDTINLASRLESLNKQYPVPIIISEFTYREIKDVLPCRILDKVQVRGKRDMIGIYEAIGFDDEKSLERAWELVKTSDTAYELYSNGEMKKALEIYRSMKESPIREVFIRRCEGMEEGK
ncbi:MAG: adenylate/guanylate cyclase domain-containing protein [Nitrospinota bacterium]|nr:adenylate/guanylate cyclase domain-containing protein [Nitrospinota bacterium]